jgi:histidyl-tRNA synthetase
LKNLSLGKQMKNANAARSSYVAFIGGDEAGHGNIKIKNMSTGDEMTVPRQETVSTLKQWRSLQQT